MALNPETYHEFERQLELQKEETENTGTNGAKTKVDEDGTEYEWDSSKNAWFPKLSVQMMMKYQENYATGEENSDPHSYVDPTTKVTFLWNSEKNRWEPKPGDNGEPCSYKHPNGITYTWNLDAGKWEPDQAEGEQSSNNETEHTYNDIESGLVYKWNRERQLWVSDDGQIKYPSPQNNAGNNSYTDPKSGATFTWSKEKGEWVADSKNNKKKDNKKKKNAAKRKAPEATWFNVDEGKNTNVYVQGLPPDISLEEYEELMTKCGIITPDPRTGKPKLKLYKDSEGNLKGDGLCCYLKKESVDLAVQLLDESYTRGGYKITVQKANFELKGSYDASKKPKSMTKKEKAQIKKQQEKMLDWKLERKEKLKKSERVLIFKNMFDVKDFEADATLITDVRDDLRRECEKFGAVKKVIVFDRHPGGVCSVAFKDFDEATACVEAMNGRWFAKKKIDVAPWDGVTDYQIEETDKEREERMKKWEEFLVEDNNSETTASEESADKKES